MKYIDDFCYAKEANMWYNQIDAFCKDEWDIEEETGKYIKHILYTLWYAKRHLSAEQHRKVKKSACILSCY